MAESKKTSFLKKHKNKVMSFVICLAISSACIGFLFYNYVNPDPESALSILENKLLDFRFKMRGEQKPTGKVGILAIDEKSLKKFGRWPIARKNYEQVMKNLKELGAGWVGLDVVWSEPERPLLEDVRETLDELKAMDGARFVSEGKQDLIAFDQAMEASPGDRSVGRAFKEYGKVVMGYAYFATKFEAEGLGDEPFKGLDAMLGSEVAAALVPEGHELKDYRQFRTHGIVANTDYIAAQTEHFAYFNNELSADSIYRWVQLVRVLDGHLMPSLSLHMASLILNRVPVVEFNDEGIKDITLMNADDDQDLLKIPVDMHLNGRILTNHLGPKGTIPHFSLADIYDMNLTDEQKAQLKDMNLLLGPTALAINDVRANPFDPAFDGVEQHATVVDNILAGKFMRRTEEFQRTELIVLFVFAALFAPLIVFTNAAYSGIAALAFLLGYYFFDQYFWFAKGQWFYMGMPGVQAMSMFIGTTLYKYMTEERDKKKMKGALSLYLSPDIANEVAADPDSLKLGGSKQELTVFFSDVRSFTTISEGLTPEKLGELMNEYFTPMAGIIQQTKGTLDKYIGDAIMAFWGAPLKMDNHADVAAKASLQMLFALDKIRADFKQKGFPAVDIGIGLNTGMMSVGNFGSPQRFCYTVMGDEVNLGARLEGATKDYGIKLMISEATQKRLTSKELITRDLDDIRVKGKLQPVKVFELIRPDMLPTEKAIKDLVGEFHLGREAYKAQQWEKAKKHFMACMSLRPEDGPSTMYMERIASKEKEPVVEGWDGVYTRKTK